MSGIAGLIDYSSLPLQEQGQMLSAANAHRGTDDRGAYSKGPALFSQRTFISLGHDRKGPITHEEWIFSIDSRCYSHSNEQLAKLWVERGPAGLEELNGTFSVAAWNPLEKKLYLFRSMDGSRPLFWTKRGSKIAFSSEIPPLLRLPWVKKELALEHLAEQLSFRYVHAPRTLLQGIYSVPAGHVVILSKESSELRKWHHSVWSSIDSKSPSTNDILDQIDTLMHQSVERRLAGKDPVGILLSGGLDSSSILYHACTLQDPPPTFTVSLEGAIQSEASFAARISKLMGAENHEIHVRKKEFIEAFDEATLCMGQPLPTAAGVVQFILFKKLRSSIRVLLSGDGGDEVFGGRSMPYLAARIARAKQISQLPYLAQRMIRKAAQKTGNRDLLARYAQFGMDRSIGASRIFLAPDRVDILSDTGLVRPGIRKTVLTPMYQEIDSDPINEILYVWQRGWLIEDSLMRADRSSAHSGIELRYPMLDTSLMRYAAQIPGSLKVYRENLDYVGKWPLRRLLHKRIPQQLLNRPKRTWLQPLDRWLLEEGKTFLQRQVDGICNDLPHLFVGSMVKRLQKEHIKGVRNHGLRLWTLILFYKWWKNTIY
ncbi:MAG: asparagine synthetase B [Myxococcota bacterium]|nr:asparagine synthetase B [Myxococcota bacterium]